MRAAFDSERAANSSATSTIKVTATVEPTTFSTALPRLLDAPTNGNYHAYWSPLDIASERTRDLKISAPYDGQYYCITFVSSERKDDRYFSVFVHPGTTVIVDIPKRKNLLMYTTYGTNWYGYDDYFGSTGSWLVSNKPFDFVNFKYTVNLEDVVNGYWQTENIESNKVPFLD